MNGEVVSKHKPQLCKDHTDPYLVVDSVIPVPDPCSPQLLHCLPHCLRRSVLPSVNCATEAKATNLGKGQTLLVMEHGTASQREEEQTYRNF